MIKVTGDDEVDDDGTRQPNARLDLAAAASTSSEILSPFQRAIGATRLAGRLGAATTAEDSNSSSTHTPAGYTTPGRAAAAGRGSLRSLAAAGRGTLSSLHAFSPRGKEQNLTLALTPTPTPTPTPTLTLTLTLTLAQAILRATSAAAPRRRLVPLRARA